MSTQRFKAEIAVSLLARTQTSPVVTDWVSYRGVFIRTDSPPTLMSLLRLEFVLPPDWGKIVMHGAVSRIVSADKADGATPGIEVTFFAKAGEESRLWDQFIQHVRDVHPDSLTRPVWLARSVTEKLRPAPVRKGVRCPVPQPRPAIMNTLPGPGSASRFPSLLPSADSWAALDAGWSIPPS
jgi:hypothetical protein